MNDKNLLHIRLDYEESLESKKDMLSSEINLLRISKIIKRYSSLRIGELNLKIKLLKKIKEIKSYLKKLQTSLPKIKLPDILKEEGEETELKHKKTPQEIDLETQLQKIQEELNSIK